MSNLSKIDPRDVFSYFMKISAIPRGSGNMWQITDYLVDFAKKHGLEYHCDAHYNVIIIKEASLGYEQYPAVILQGHTDMVCEKTVGSEHNFEQEGLKLAVEGDFLFAEDTTLGGDNGIAVAYALAILADKTLKHPRIEVVLTSDEEIGLLGAMNLDTSILQGKRMINLDSEEEGLFFAGCAGGCTAEVTLSVRREEKEAFIYELVIDGLKGGHSGGEIDKQRGNSNVLMGRFLNGLRDTAEFQIEDLGGGLKDNAIPKRTTARIAILESDIAALEQLAEEYAEIFKHEFRRNDPEVRISLSRLGKQTASLVQKEDGEKIVFLLLQSPNGVQRYSMDMENLVETSLNMGICRLKEHSLELHFSVRSSVESLKLALVKQLKSLTEFLGGHFTVQGDYPGWEYQKDSLLQRQMIEVYREMYGKEPIVEAIHAGLECGVFVSKMPGLDCISIGPEMYDVHTTDERMSISSVKRVYEYLVQVLSKLH